MITRLGINGYGVPAAGSFAGKVAFTDSNGWALKSGVPSNWAKDSEASSEWSKLTWTYVDNWSKL